MATVVVTGANRGIGLALATLLKERGDNVVATCRQASAALNDLGVEVVPGVEVTDAAAGEQVKAALGARKLDLLINNAGILLKSGDLETPDYDAIRKQLEVNAIGPLRITSALQSCFAPKAKVALITSRMGSIEDNTSGGAYGYRMSKAALNIAGKSMAEDLKAQGVAVTLLHPGMVKTDMIGGRGQVEPEEAARGLLARVDELSLESSGTFWHAKGQQLPW